MQERPANFFLLVVGLIGPGLPFGHPLFWGECHQITQWRHNRCYRCRAPLMAEMVCSPTTADPSSKIRHEQRINSSGHGTEAADEVPMMAGSGEKMHSFRCVTAV